MRFSTSAAVLVEATVSYQDPFQFFRSSRFVLLAQRIRIVTDCHAPFTGYAALSAGKRQPTGSTRTCFSKIGWPVAATATSQAVTITPLN